jgi:hypothetical protein
MKGRLQHGRISTNRYLSSEADKKHVDRLP